MSEPVLGVNAAVYDTLVVVNRRQTADYDIYAGRPTVLGNPFKGPTRDEAVAQYESWAWERMQKDTGFRQAILACEGKRVACWCYPLNCHVNAIARLIERWKKEHK